MMKEHFILENGPIGLGATAEIAKIYMEEFPLRAAETFPYPLDEWYWYASVLKCKDEES